jgi:hypothetical protein
MKVTIPEIAWHNRDPVFSADFSLGEGSQWRMATAGADSDVKVFFKTIVTSTISSPIFFIPDFLL